MMDGHIPVGMPVPAVTFYLGMFTDSVVADGLGSQDVKNERLICGRSVDAIGPVPLPQQQHCRCTYFVFTLPWSHPIPYGTAALQQACARNL